LPDLLRRDHIGLYGVAERGDGDTALVLDPDLEYLIIHSTSCGHANMAPTRHDGDFGS
jgi:hypothetical protein